MSTTGNGASSLAWPARKAEMLGTPYPMADRRNLITMLNAGNADTTRRRRHHLVGFAQPQRMKTEFRESLERFMASVEFQEDTPVRWHAGSDMNVALPGAGIVIDPAVNAGSPTVTGTLITTRAVLDTLRANDGNSRTTARILDITGNQAEAAGAYELSLNLPRPIAGGPWGRWHFTIPGNPEDALSKLEEHLHRVG